MSLAIQIGSFSNFIGAHQWNQHQAEWNASSEDSTRFERVFGESRPSRHVVNYYPRVVMVDTPGALGGNGVYGENDDNGQHLEFSSEQRVDKSLFNKEDWDANNWTMHNRSVKAQNDRDDFFSAHTRVCPHPYTRYLNNPGLETPFKHGSRETFNFSETVTHFTDYLVPTWNHQKNFLPYDPLLDSCDDAHNTFWDNYEDKLRLQLEDVDTLESLHITVDWLSSFSQVGIFTFRWVSEEAPKTPRLISGWVPPEFADNNETTKVDTEERRKKELARHISGALLVHHVLEETQSHEVLILSDYSSLNVNVPLYEASAAPALALECCTGPFSTLTTDLVAHNDSNQSRFLNLRFKCFDVATFECEKPGVKDLWDVQSYFQFPQRNCRNTILYNHLPCYAVLRGVSEQQRRDWQHTFGPLHTVRPTENSVHLSLPYPVKTLSMPLTTKEVVSVSTATTDVSLNETLCPVTRTLQRCLRRNRIPSCIESRTHLDAILEKFNMYFDRQEEFLF